LLEPLEGELEADGEEQQCNAEFTQNLHILTGTDEPGTGGSEQQASQQIPDNRVLAKSLQDQTRSRRGREQSDNSGKQVPAIHSTHCCSRRIAVRVRVLQQLRTCEFFQVGCGRRQLVRHRRCVQGCLVDTQPTARSR
jgi:hypothetical protein